MLYLTVMLVFLGFAAIAMTVNEGLWNNTIALFNVMLGGLLGIFAGVPLGNLILAQAGGGPTSAWYYIFATVWGVFAVSVFLMGFAAKAASGVKMRFLPMLDNIAGPLMGILVALMLTSFAAFTLERVPIKANEWQLSTAADWQISALQYARAPFRGVVKSFAQGEKADHEFLGK